MIRRLRSILILSLPLVLLASGYLWYRYNFPIPRVLVDPNDPFGQGKLAWMYPYQDRLVHWKFRQFTPRVPLAGSRWRHPDSGAECEFGKDGNFRWVKLPEPSNAFLNGESYSLAKAIDGSPFLFHPEKRGLVWNHSEGTVSSIESNLEFPGQPWEGILGYDGRHLGIKVGHEDYPAGIDRDFTIIFTEKMR